MRAATLRLSATLSICLMVALSSAVQSQGSAADSAAIRQWLVNYSDAWNRRDAKRAASLYLAEADIRTISGDRLQGRDAIEEAHAGDLAADTAGGGSRSSHPPATLWMRFLRSDMALVEVESRFDFPPDSTGPVRPELNSLFLVFKKEHGHWSVLAQREMQR